MDAKKSKETKEDLSYAGEVLGNETHLHKATITAPSDRLAGEVYTIPLNEIIKRFTDSLELRDPTCALLQQGNTQNKSGNAIPLPPLVNRDGEEVSEECAADAKSRYVDKYEAKDNPYGYNVLNTQQNFFPNQIDFGFLNMLINDTNLGNIQQIPSHNSSEVNFVMSLPNRVKGNMAVQFDKGKPVFMFSSFLESYQWGVVAKDMSQGTNYGWLVLDHKWVREAFSIYGAEEGDDKYINLPVKPTGYDHFDRERILVDHSTAILLHCYTDLAYNRIASSIRFHKAHGFITEVIITGMYEKANYVEFVKGIIMLLEDNANLKKEGQKVVNKINNSIAKQLTELGGELDPKEVQECYKSQFEFAFQDDPMLANENVDFGSIQTEGGGRTLFIADKIEGKEEEEEILAKDVE